MIVSVIRSKYSKGNPPKKIVCNAQIPLFFLKNLSSGSIKRLALRLGVTTIEELHLIDNEEISNCIHNRRILKEIFDAKAQIGKRALVKKHVIKFEDRAFEKNIRIKPSQRQFLIAISLFKEILKDIDDVIIFVLDVNNDQIPFRQRALLKSLYEISRRALKAA